MQTNPFANWIDFAFLVDAVWNLDRWCSKKYKCARAHTHRQSHEQRCCQTNGSCIEHQTEKYQKSKYCEQKMEFLWSNCHKRAAKSKKHTYILRLFSDCAFQRNWIWAFEMNINLSKFSSDFATDFFFATHSLSSQETHSIFFAANFIMRFCFEKKKKNDWIARLLTFA